MVRGSPPSPVSMLTKICGVVLARVVFQTTNLYNKTCLVGDDVVGRWRRLGEWTKARGAAMFGAWQTV